LRAFAAIYQRKLAPNHNAAASCFSARASKSMRILYVAMKYDYGRPEQGFSYEHSNFYGCLRDLGHDIHYFDFLSLEHELGREAMNRSLLEVAKKFRPQLMFSCLFEENFHFQTIRQISDSGDTITLNWFSDDHWRFDTFSSRWAPAFNFVATTSTSALPKYEAIGYKNVLKTQWACNHFEYRPLNFPLDTEVSFVGMAHGIRPQLVASLRSAGIKIITRGKGWPEGRINQEEMIRLFNRSRINLNFSNASRKPSLLKRLFKGAKAQLQQIKGRNFEIPGCGGFLLTDATENLAEYYTLGKEVVVYESMKDLIDKTRYYLAHEKERAAIAKAGYERTIREHTYEIRFRDLFTRMGLPQ
jgi:spore maturation protein CgeB